MLLDVDIELETNLTWGWTDCTLCQPSRRSREEKLGPELASYVDS